MAICFECNGKQFKRLVGKTFGEENVESYIKKLPNFKLEYQAWYSEALAVVKQVLPDRLQDFKSYFESPRVRKGITFQNYMIRDYLQGLFITRGIDNEIVDGNAAIPEFQQQLNIVKAAKGILRSSLIELTSILQADLFDSEVDSARSLSKSGYLRAAGAVCGVVIEKHLKHATGWS